MFYQFLNFYSYIIKNNPIYVPISTAIIMFDTSKITN